MSTLLFERASARTAGLLAALSVCVALSPASSAQLSVELIASDGAFADAFGRVVSIDGSRTLVGAPDADDAGPASGSVYVFQSASSVLPGCSVPSQTVELTALDAGAGDRFGAAVSLSGATLVVGAPGDGPAAPESGAAYVFEQTPAGFVQTAKLIPSDASLGQRFGTSVAISGDALVVGASAPGVKKAGAAYVFERTPAGWVETARLTTSSTLSVAFGACVSIAGDLVAVGDPGDATPFLKGQGVLAIFERGPAGWASAAELLGIVSESVAVSGQTVLAGRTLHANALVYERTGGVFVHTATLTGASERFGAAVALDGDVAVVGAPGDDALASDSGAAYMYQRGPAGWAQTSKLDFALGGGASGRQLGSSVAVAGDTALAGAPQPGVGSGQAFVHFTDPPEDFDVNPQPLSAEEVEQLNEVVDLIAAVFGVGEGGDGPGFVGPPSPFWNDLGLGAGPGQIGYTNQSLEQALAILKAKLASGEVKKSDLPPGAAATVSDAGTGTDDLILISDFDVLLLDLTSAVGKVRLGYILMNELTHVFQVNGDATTDAQDCDAERDSDCASIGFLDGVLDALTDDDGTPHAADDIELPKLKACVGSSSVAVLAKLVADDLAALQARKDGLFGKHIAAGTSWAAEYYGAAHDDGPKFLPVKDAGRAFTTVANAVAERVYLLPPGELLVQSAALGDPLTQLALVSASVTSGGQTLLRFWSDVDGDRLPELPAASAPIALGAPGAPGADPGLEGVRFYPLGASRLLIHDTLAGTVHALRLGADALPAGDAPVLLFASPEITTAGTYTYFGGAIEAAPGALRFVFSDQPPVGLAFGSDTVSFEATCDIVGPGVGSAGPGQTLAQALAPENPVGISAIGELTSSFRLRANPGDFVTLSSIGAGFAAPLAAGLAGADGRTPALLAGGGGPGGTLASLYLVTNGTDAATYFLPPLGLAVGSVAIDDDHNGVADTVVLSVDPPRLHYLAGVPGAAPSDPVRTYVAEQVSPVAHALGFVASTWASGSRELATAAGSEALVRIPGSSPPAYRSAATTGDFDGQGAAGEAIVVRRAPGQDAFVADVYFGAGLEPFVAQSIPLGAGLAPRSVQLADVDGDGDTDVVIDDQRGGPTARLVNDGSGAFAFELRGLSVSPAALSLATGGTHSFALSAGAESAGSLYFVLGTLSGSFPGVDLGAGLHLELNPDAYLQLTLTGADAPPFVATSGLLDATGSASAALALPAGLNPALAGLPANHAFLVLDPALGALSFVSNATALELVAGAVEGPCPDGTDLGVDQTVWECNGGTCCQVKKKSYACPDGTVQTTETILQDTGLACSGPNGSVCQ